MSKELTISNLDQHLKPLQIDGVTTPIELSTEAIRMNKEISLQQDLFISGDIHCTGKYDGLNLDHGMKIYSSASINGGVNINAAYLSLYANIWTGDGDESDNKATLVLIASDGYDSQINLMEASSTRWTIGNDADDSDKLKFDAGTPVVGGATKLTLDSSGNLTAAGEFVSSNMLYSGGIHQFYGSGGDNSNFYGIQVLANGVTTLSTVSSSTDASDFTIDANGDITLDSSTGVFIAQKGGTEFSAANSAYAGMILGYTDIGLDEARQNVALTTSYVVPTDEFSVSFTAPPSGNVEIMISVCYNAGSSGAGDLYAGLSSTNATSGYTQLQDYHEEELIDQSGRFGRDTVQNYWTLTGLTAGTAYEYWVGFKSSSTTGSPGIEYGGSASGHNPDFIMKATALPATITT